MLTRLIHGFETWNKIFVLVLVAAGACTLAAILVATDGYFREVS